MKKVLIMGAAGRDFHNFNLFFRNNRHYRVVAFTATQIPNIENRAYPGILSGPSYPRGIPIYSERMLAQLVRRKKIDVVVFAYSDVSYDYVMHKAALAMAAGADFWLMGPKSSMLRSKKWVISICAVRTGAGKSQTTRRVCEILKKKRIQYSVVRHPMPYGRLSQSIVQKLSTMSDLDKYHCTIEEREEYEPHIKRGTTVFAGVDYQKILREAEKISDVVVWDGGNNDMPFYEPDLHIVVCDPFRIGHETSYHPGEANLRMADVVIINKVDTAPTENVRKLKKNIVEVNPKATIIEAQSPISVNRPELIRRRKALVVEDGPTLTHGEMTFGAGVVAAEKFKAAKIVNPKKYAVGSIRQAYVKYPRLGNVLPALGYGERQRKELEKTINSIPADVVIIATPVNLSRFIKLNKPAVKVSYELKEVSKPNLQDIITKLLKR